MGTTAFEKRGIALAVPAWNPEKCVQCTDCSFVCPHAAIRPYLLSEAEEAAAPQGFTTAAARYGGSKDAKLFYRIQVFPDDCVGCGSCATICPGKALDMVPVASIHDVQAQCLDYVQTRVTRKIRDSLPLLSFPHSSGNLSCSSPARARGAARHLM